MQKFDKEFQKLWIQNDFSTAYSRLLEYLNDKENLGGAQCYDEKCINEAFFLEHLLEIAPVLYNNVKETLTKLPKNHVIRLAIMISLLKSITKNPIILMEQPELIKNLILENLETTNGLDFLIQMIIQNIDLFNSEELTSLIKNLDKNEIIHQDSITQIGFEFISGLNQFLNRNIDGFKEILSKIVKNIPELMIENDITYTFAHLINILSIFSNLKYYIGKFQGFDVEFEKLSDKIPESGCWISEEAKFWGSYSVLINKIVENIFNVLNNPVYLSPKQNIENINDILSKMQSFYGSYIKKNFSDNLWKDRPDFHPFLESIFKNSFKSLEVLEHISNYALRLKDLFNFDLTFDSSKISEMNQYKQNIKSGLNLISFMPLRVVLKHLFELMEEKEKLYTEIRSILDSIMEKRKKIVPILGPFSDKDPASSINEYFTRISIKLSNTNKSLIPVFIPGQYQGIRNSILFDLFIQMSKFIICLYIPSKSAGHVDEISRLLERRLKPPIILLSNCKFPTTTQVEGIDSNKNVKIFCFHEKGCLHIDNCYFSYRCRKEQLPKSTIEEALECALNWVISEKEP